MPFNGSGVFQRVRNWVADATAGIKIRADYHDAEDDGFAAGLTNCITKDGQTVVTQNIPMNSKRVTGLADPINPQDAATKAYTDTKMPLTGGTINGDLDVAGNISAFGYKTRKGLAGPYGGNWFNFFWDGNLEAWIDNHNFGYIASVAYVNAQDAAIQAALQAQINTKQANLGFTPVQQAGAPGMIGNKVYIGWDGAGKLLCQVDNSPQGAFYFGTPPAAGINGVQLALAGNASWTGGQTVSEPFAGAVCTGLSAAAGGGMTGRFRYLQVHTTSWFTVGYV